MPQKMTITELVEANRNMSFAIQENSVKAVIHMARTAACQEMRDDDTHSEQIHWHIVRIMCNEFGLDNSVYVKSARAYANQLYKSRQRNSG